MSYIFGLLLILIILYYLFYHNNVENLENSDKETEYQPYKKLESNPTFIGMQNASNITFLKSQMEDLIKLKEKVSKMDDTVKLNQKGLMQIANQITKAGHNVMGGPIPKDKPLPQISGM